MPRLSPGPSNLTYFAEPRPLQFTRPTVIPGQSGGGTPAPPAAYNPVHPYGELFAPALIRGVPESEAAFSAWQGRHPQPTVTPAPGSTVGGVGTNTPILPPGPNGTNYGGKPTGQGTTVYGLGGPFIDVNGNPIRMNG